MVLATGTVLFGDDLEPFDGATVYVRLEEVSRLDAPARLVTEQVLRGMRAGSDAREIPFVLESARLDPRGSYSIRVHVDVDGDGEVSVGDYVSTRSYRVPPAGDLAAVAIPVRRVG